MALFMSGDSVMLMTDFREGGELDKDKLEQAWVCWNCDEGVAAAGPEYNRAEVAKFMKAHEGCFQGRER